MAQSPAGTMPVDVLTDGRRAATTSIRPFRVEVAEPELAELRRRLSAARWPAKEVDAGQGVGLAVLEALTRYWATTHDWRSCEARLNTVPQFTTAIDGLEIHFVHVRSPHPNALPLIITHGWPGSVIELLPVVGPLTDPPAFGGRPDDAFDLVLPSLPGFGFSAQPTTVGWHPAQTATAWAELMRRLGYDRYVAQGGDIGAAVTDAMAVQAPAGLAGIHLNFLRRLPPAIGAASAGTAPLPASLTADEHIAFEAYRNQFHKGYIAEQSGSPQTIGYALNDSPAGLAGWILDHDTDSYAKIARAFVDGQPSGGLTRDAVLDNIALYWLTNTAASSARMYWEAARASAASQGNTAPEVSLPVAFTVFPGEIFRAPRSWAEAVYPNLVYFNEVDRGGHFAAWEEPELFARELQDAFRGLRA